MTPEGVIEKYFELNSQLGSPQALNPILEEHIDLAGHPQVLPKGLVDLNSTGHGHAHALFGTLSMIITRASHNNEQAVNIFALWTLTGHIHSKFQQGFRLTWPSKKMPKRRPLNHLISQGSREIELATLLSGLK